MFVIVVRSIKLFIMPHGAILVKCCLNISPTESFCRFFSRSTFPNAVKSSTSCKSGRSPKNNLSSTVVRSQNPSATLYLHPRPGELLIIFLLLSPSRDGLLVSSGTHSFDVNHSLLTRTSPVEIHHCNLLQSFRKDILLARFR